MLGLRMVRLIEGNSETLAQGLVEKLHRSERTTAFRDIPEPELRVATLAVYNQLGDWLLSKTESDIEFRYKEVGVRRAQQHIPLSQLLWALLMSKEHLWAFAQRQGLAARAVELYAELELLQTLDHFFERAMYFASLGYEEANRNARAA